MKSSEEDETGGGAVTTTGLEEDGRAAGSRLLGVGRERRRRRLLDPVWPSATAVLARSTIDMITRFIGTSHGGWRAPDGRRGRAAVSA